MQLKRYITVNNTGLRNGIFFSDQTRTGMIRNTEILNFGFKGIWLFLKKRKEKMDRQYEKHKKKEKKTPNKLKSN